jgi:predicted hotdog family 3-hydroxylacyl-ACP dehydratase
MNFDLKAVMAHKPPMLLVDKILKAEKGVAATAFKIKEDNIFLGDQGILSREALIEVMAQSLAALNGHNSFTEGKEIAKGFLVGLKNINFYADAYVGNELICNVKIIDFISQTYIAQAEVFHNATLLANGELRIFAF